MTESVRFEFEHNGTRYEVIGKFGRGNHFSASSKLPPSQPGMASSRIDATYPSVEDEEHLQQLLPGTFQGFTNFRRV